MNARTTGYWTTTGLLGFAFAAGGIMDLTHAPELITTLGQLGYPPYVATLLGAWKLLGATALLAPRLPRVKEWAYAGIAFDLSGAVFSHLAVGDPASKVVAPLLLLGLAVASWSLRPESRMLRATGGAGEAPNGEAALARGAARAAATS
jgi:uncharacterized membrane protein YphA (DoxX/SURF4 family)